MKIAIGILSLLAIAFLILWSNYDNESIPPHEDNANYRITSQAFAAASSINQEISTTTQLDRSRSSADMLLLNSIKERIDKAANKEERNSLLVQIARDHFTTSDISTKNSIASAIRHLILSGEHQESLGIATIVYSRMGTFADTRDILLYSHNKGYINNDEYATELIQMISDVAIQSKEEAHKLISEVMTFNSPSVRAQLFGTVPSMSFLSNIGDESVKVLVKFANESKPSFDVDIAVTGYFSANTYEEWLNSLISLHSRLDSTHEVGAILKRIYHGRIDDPREALVLYNSDIYRKIGNSADNRALKSEIESLVLTYRNEYPSSALVRDMDPQIFADIEAKGTKPVAKPSSAGHP